MTAVDEDEVEQQSSGATSTGPSDDTGTEGGPDERPPQQPGHLAMLGDVIPSEPPCDTGASCCPSGTVAVLGTQAADVLTGSASNRCWVALGGNDQVTDNSAAGTHALLGGPGVDTLTSGLGPAIAAGGTGNDSITTRNGADELYGQADNDSLTAGVGDDRLFGGTGADTLYAGGDNDILNGGAGNDKLYGEGGHDFLIGGPGKDEVYGGAGDDTVLVYDVCELASGEVLNGGIGNDLLYIPVTLAQVQSLGVTVTGFETIVVRPGREPLAECAGAYASWELLGRAGTEGSALTDLETNVGAQPPLPSDQNPGPTNGGNYFVPTETTWTAVDLPSLLVYRVTVSSAQATAFAGVVNPHVANGSSAPPLVDTSQTGTGPCDRVPLDNESFPRTAIGLLTLKWKGAIGHCTGALVGPRHVLTAAHCVYRTNDESDAFQGYADQYTFIAGSGPGGASAADPVDVAEWIWEPVEWPSVLDTLEPTDENLFPRRSDIAVMSFWIPVGGTPPGVQVGGWFGWWFQSGVGYHGNHYYLRGYPECGDADFCEGAGTNCAWQSCVPGQLYGAGESCDCWTSNSYDNEATAVPHYCGNVCWNALVPHGCFASKGMSGGPFYFYQTFVNPHGHVISGVHIEQRYSVPAGAYVEGHIRRLTPVVSDMVMYLRVLAP